ncbi:MAG: [citrate (pro-3S)-lyase] ligase [Sedimentibacter sp.]|uniref:[citrate (pro-3S)-lyase] ligase n=1 Tax=Sedimentibacter sp. TaxID=1960295 RepID=UPI0031592771
MYGKNVEIRTVNLKNRAERSEVDEFLKQQELLLEKDVEFTLAIYEDDKIIGTGSITGNVLKCIAIDPEFQGEGFSNKLVSMLLSEQYQRGNSHLFIFTKPKNSKMFQDFGFKEITSVDGQVTLLENNPRGIEDYTSRLKSQRRDGKIVSGLVMNCNPFTFGHQYLIETASANSDVVHIFVVWEDRSVFPSNVRYRLVKEGTKHLKNVFVHRGENYIISNSTFPSYFLKEKNSIVSIHAKLDVKIFGEFIAPALGINRRYVGQELSDPVTKEYNTVMIETLRDYNIEVIEIERKKIHEAAVSASRVRELIRNGEIEKVRHLVPQTTYEFLISEEAGPIVEKIINDKK